MKRRTFLKYSSTSILFPNLVSTLNASEYTTVEKRLFTKDFFANIFGLKVDEPQKLEVVKETKDLNLKVEEEKVDIEEELNNINEELASSIEVHKDSLKQVNKGDVFLEEKYIQEFISVKQKLQLVQNHVGYGNFNILNFDHMLKVAKNSSKIGAFTKKELDFLEFIFYYDPSHHGFFGERTSQKITQEISKNEVTKIPYTGHYLFKGEAEQTYLRMCKDIGDSLTLTSGVRSIVKQTKLFLDKLDSSNANLSLASKSLAPPAYTYHALADFDVGKKGFGHANFTSRFALTQEFLKMRKLKYIDMRYTINNKDGVRYEPWHVKII